MLICAPFSLFAKVMHDLGMQITWAVQYSMINIRTTPTSTGIHAKVYGLLTFLCTKKLLVSLHGYNLDKTLTRL